MSAGGPSSLESCGRAAARTADVPWVFLGVIVRLLTAIGDVSLISGIDALGKRSGR